MCGIAGMLSADTLDAEDLELVRRINSLQEHRGPDGSGEYTDRHVALAMRRLSIIDLEGGWQPLYNEDRSLALVANGEIYNFVELRSDLERRGHRFSTGSDCETIAHLYEEHGDDCVDHLRGMFAFALWDTRRRRLLLARDRMGEKPLYFHRSGRRLIFASELKSLTLSGAVSSELDVAALNAYFHYQYIPEPATPVLHVRKVPAGGRMSIEVDSWRIQESIYWDMEAAPPLEGHPASVIREELERVSELVVRADVPVGVALSGGLDSSAVAALAAPKCRGQLQAFSVGYAGQHTCDERSQARQFADHLGVPFHDVELHTSDVVQQFRELVHFRDEPIADISGTGYYAVMKLAREHGVPVVLQGHGGDELFWGYPWVRQCVDETMRKDAWLCGDKLPPSDVTPIGPRSYSPRALARWARGYWRSTKTRRQVERSLAEAPGRMFFYDLTPDFQYASRHAAAMYTSAFTDRLNGASPEEVFTFSRPWPRIDVRMTRLICETYLRINGIVQGDRLSMASGVELRLPLLDYRLVETVIGLRKQTPDHHLAPKAWLREALSEILPDWVMQRPKRGFAPPVREWHDAIFREYGSALRGGYLVAAGVLRPEKAQELSMGPFPTGTVAPLSFKALVLELWCRSCLGVSPIQNSSGRKTEILRPTQSTHKKRATSRPAPIAVFAFKRPQHLRRTLISLAQNTLAANSSLTIFCDGPRRADEEPLIEEARAVAKSQKWCRDVEIVERSENLGLARSIVEGVTRLTADHGRIIVLEDDLEVAPSFLDFMNRGLDRYEDDAQVMQVSAFMFPIEPVGPRAACFLPLTTSWGWATWQRAWQQFRFDAEEDDTFLQDAKQRAAFDLQGAYPYSAMLESQRKGCIDSWAIRWYRTVFLQGGLVLYPPQSLVNNTGFDGTGTHCGTVAGFDCTLSDEVVEALPASAVTNEGMLARVAAYLGQTQTPRPGKLLSARAWNSWGKGVLDKLRRAG